jgi:3-hydroxypropanoate dehydrogenase
VPTLTDADLHLLFLDARTHSAWRDEPVSDATLERLYDLIKLAPTSANGQPVRIVFVRSADAKKKLEPTLSPGNVAKTMSAPVTAIVAWDTKFYEHFDKLSPQMAGLSAKIAAAPEAMRERMGLMSATLQGGYLILGARGLGLDCGPMGGFDPAKVDAAFFPDGRWRSIFLMNLGHADASQVKPRSPRLGFAEACRIE